MARGPSEIMCKVAKMELLKHSAVEAGDKTFLTIPLFDDNLVLNTNQSNIFSSLPPFALPHAIATTIVRIEHVCVSN
jgi:hypothetical protein